MIRHGQASFMAENYDQLSQLGQTQARILGGAWAAADLHFDRVCSGPRERQKDTAKLVATAYAEAGREFPEIESYPEFDEYHADAVMQSGLPMLVARDARAAELEQAFNSAADATLRHRSFQQLFEYVMAHWVRGDVVIEGSESWKQFCARVNAGVDRLVAQQGRSGRIAVFSSAGPMAVAMQRALSLSDAKTLDLSWMPRNACWSEFLYTDEKFAVSTFNAYGHLVDPAHLTYR